MPKVTKTTLYNRVVLHEMSMGDALALGSGGSGRRLPKSKNVILELEQRLLQKTGRHAIVCDDSPEALVLGDRALTAGEPVRLQPLGGLPVANPNICSCERGRSREDHQQARSALR